jgi:hypothetical protein
LPRDDRRAIESPLHVQIGLQVSDDVGMRRRRQQADVPPSQDPAQVEGDHLGQRAIQVRAELVSHDPPRLLRHRQRKTKPVPLTITEFRWRA